VPQRDATDATGDGRTFPAYRFAGSHRQIGRAYGEACRPLIQRHLAYARLRLEARIPGFDPAVAAARALAYRPFVQRHAPFLDEEIAGVAEGAALALGDAYLLQLRAEAQNDLEQAAECTTFAILPAATANGIGLVGQNADLPAFYADVAVVAELAPDDGPSCLVLTPAGQVSYIGINAEGLGMFANFLSCGGWRVGYPRYLFTRLGLRERTAGAAIDAIAALPRASSRNLIALDAGGGALDAETTPEALARLEPVGGVLAHANHFLSPALQRLEAADPAYLHNSRARQARMEELLRSHRGRLDAVAMRTVLRDRQTAPDSLCRRPEDAGFLPPAERDVITFASVIAEPAEGRMWVAVGPPDAHPYRLYRMA